MGSTSDAALVVEGDGPWRRALADVLAREGYRVDLAADGDDAVRLGAVRPHAVVLLAAAIPRGDGFEVCRALRKIQPAVPVIMMVDGADDLVRLREPGAGPDRWLRKPFVPGSVLPHVRGLRHLADVAREAPGTLEVDGLRLDLANRRAARHGRPAALTAREVAILRWLYHHRTRAVSRAELLEEVWGVSGDLETRTVDMTISNLRRKIEPRATVPTIIVTVKGFGYVWGVDD